jgi:hypothetical protein
MVISTTTDDAIPLRVEADEWRMMGWLYPDDRLETTTACLTLVKWTR